ncbi:MAG: YbhN family protein [Oscillospiraceae bacterium]
MKRRAPWLGPVLIAAVLALTVWTVFRGQPVSEVLSALKRMRLPFVALGLLLMCSFVGCEAMSSRTILRQLGNAVSYRRCLGYSFTGFLFSSITPSSSGGQPAQVCCMARDGIPAAHGALTMLLNAVCYQTVTLGLAVGAMVWRPALLHDLGGGLGFLLGMGAAVAVSLTAGMLALLFAPRPAGALCGRVLELGARLRLVRDLPAARERLERQMEEYRRGGACLQARPTLLPRLLGLTVLQLVSLYLVPGVVYGAFGLSGRSVPEIVAMQAILTLAVGYLPLPGAVGAAEGAFLRGYALFFGTELVAPAMLASRGISFYSFLLIASAVTLLVRLRARRTGPAADGTLLQKGAPTE